MRQHNKQLPTTIKSKLYELLIECQARRIQVVLGLAVDQNGIPLGWKIEVGGFHPVDKDNKEQIYQYLGHAVKAIAAMLEAKKSGELVELEQQQSPATE
jgi:hypothetical protein